MLIHCSSVSLWYYCFTDGNILWNTWITPKIGFSLTGWTVTKDAIRIRKIKLFYTTVLFNAKRISFRMDLSCTRHRGDLCSAVFGRFGSVIGSVQFRQSLTENGQEVIGNCHCTSARNPKPRNLPESTGIHKNCVGTDSVFERIRSLDWLTRVLLLTLFQPLIQNHVEFGNLDSSDSFFSNFCHTHVSEIMGVGVNASSRKWHPCPNSLRKMSHIELFRVLAKILNYIWFQIWVSYHEPFWGC